MLDTLARLGSLKSDHAAPVARALDRARLLDHARREGWTALPAFDVLARALPTAELVGAGLARLDAGGMRPQWPAHRLLIPWTAEAGAEHEHGRTFARRSLLPPDERFPVTIWPPGRRARGLLRIGAEGATNEARRVLVPDALDGIALLAYAEARGRAVVAYVVPWLEWLPLDDPPFAAGERVYVSIPRPHGYELARRLAARGVKVHELAPPVGGSWAETWEAYRAEHEAEAGGEGGEHEDDLGAPA
ncbi:hypothetical protein [Polyangium sp. 6x1]|uniref:hypothetical protein n=1 Tax=Polyangium sp. 6x1 TaxID=3042689 RepID=UPI0024826293|nr:hypothetical protein [Polyangium sp. 6x1]MDI1449336.1 hypothetical protein [Polyangium sp. 6x1]